MSHRPLGWILAGALAMAGCAGVEPVPPTTANGEPAASSMPGEAEVPSATTAPAAPPGPARSVSYRVAVETDDGQAVDAGIAYRLESPDGRLLGGGATSSGTMPVMAREGMVVRISVSEEGYVPVLREFVAQWSEEPPVITLRLERNRRPATLRLLVAEEGGAVPESVVLDVKDRAEDSIAGFFRAHLALDEEGTGTVEGLPPGDYVLEVAGAVMFRSFLVPARIPVAFRAGETTEVHAALVRGGYVRVLLPPLRGEDGRGEGPWLRDAEGNDVDALFCTVTEDGAALNPPDRPGPVLHWQPVPPGRYTVLFGPDEGRRFEVEVIVRAGAITEAAVQYPEEK